MDDPATPPAAGVRDDDEALRRSTVAVVVSSLLALVLVAAAAAIVAYVVLRTPAAAVDPTARQEPVGMARAAPSDPSAGLASAPEPPVLDVGGAPASVTALPTIAVTVMAQDTPSPAQAPTPTPRVMALPTVAVPTQPPRVAAARARSGERGGLLHLGSFGSFGADAPRATPTNATAAHAIPIATPSVPATTPGTLAVGTRVVVAVPSARLRGAPSLEGPVLAGLPQGRALEVTGPPVAGSGYLWYPVAVRKEPGLAGYVAADLIAPKAS